MPRINNQGATQDKRKREIRKVLEQYGKVARDELFRLVPMKLGVDAKSIRSSLYKDLKAMVLDLEIEEQHFTLDGAPISKADLEKLEEQYSDSKVPPYRTTWSLKGYELQISGAKLLRDLGGDFILPNQSLIRDFAIYDAKRTVSTSVYSLMFEVGNKVLYLSIDQAAIPFKFVIARHTGPEFVFPRDQFLELYGPRSALLLLPNRVLSSYRHESRPGHFLITFNRDAGVSVADLGGKNPGSLVRLTESELSKIDLILGATVNQTVTEPLLASAQLRRDPVLLSSTPYETKLPSMIFIEAGFALFVR